MQTLVVLTLMAIWLLSGCAPSVNPPIVPYPITYGVHPHQPNRSARTIVWGGSSVVVETATRWLQTHGVTVIEEELVRRLAMMEPRTAPTDTPADELQILHLGQQLGADEVLFVESKAAVEDAEPAQHTRIFYNLYVTMKAVKINTGEVAWKGAARYPAPTYAVTDGLTKLTCQALATAWGFRPPGQLEIPSQAMCTVGQREVGRESPPPTVKQ